MKILNQNLKMLTLLVLSGALIFLYPTSVLMMNHSSAMSMETPMMHGSITGQSLVSSMPINDTNQCVNFHLNLLQNLSQASQQTPAGIILFMFIILALTLYATNLVKQLLEYLQTLLLLKQHRLKSISLESFMTQLGDWLAIIVNKSPAYVFTTA